MKDRWLDQDWSETYEVGRQWHRDGGNFHSLYWMVAVIEALKSDATTHDFLGKHASWSVTNNVFSYDKITIHDYGCGEGDGTIYLQTLFPFAQITGYDLWPGAIELAAERWTSNNITWKLGDVSDPQEHCDLLFSIQTTDHVDDVAASVNACIKRSKMHVIAWANLRGKPEHPSQDRNWLNRVPQPVMARHIYLPRVDWKTNQLIPDQIQTFAWIGAHDPARSNRLAEDSTRFAT